MIPLCSFVVFILQFLVYTAYLLFTPPSSTLDSFAHPRDSPCRWILYLYLVSFDFHIFILCLTHLSPCIVFFFFFTAILEPAVFGESKPRTWIYSNISGRPRLFALSSFRHLSLMGFGLIGDTELLKWNGNMEYGEYGIRYMVYYRLELVPLAFYSVLLFFNFFPFSNPSLFLFLHSALPSVLHFLFRFFTSFSLHFK